MYFIHSSPNTWNSDKSVKQIFIVGRSWPILVAFYRSGDENVGKFRKANHAATRRARERKGREGCSNMSDITRRGDAMRGETRRAEAAKEWEIVEKRGYRGK